MEAGTFFPIFIPNSIFEFSRISWCYGDLGIVIAILQAGIITQNKFWIEESLKIGIQISKRKDKIGIQDACLCHGTAGNGHIFNRLYQYSEIEEFKNASIFWYAETLKFHELYGHFKFYTNDIDNQWKKEQGILEGSAGIGLALISAISHIEPKWDRSLLLS
jgi:lantibiotic modifying enzyme